MKKILLYISWLSFFSIVAVVGTFSIWCGASAANYLKDLFHVEGFWCLALVPVIFMVAVAVTYFFILGMNLIRKP